MSVWTKHLAVTHTFHSANNYFRIDRSTSLWRSHVCNCTTQQIFLNAADTTSAKHLIPERPKFRWLAVICYFGFCLWRYLVLSTCNVEDSLRAVSCELWPTHQSFRHRKKLIYTSLKIQLQPAGWSSVLRKSSCNGSILIMLDGNHVLVEVAYCTLWIFHFLTNR